jgi:hypothetical protein
MPRSLQEQEQGRRRPESAVRAYLSVMDRNPKAVEKSPHEQAVSSTGTLACVRG